jgi:pilus assembly protein Flp/PilA
LGLGVVNRVLKRLWREEEGQDLVEYGLLIALVALGTVTAMKGLASAIASVFNSASTSLTTS